MNNTTFLSRGAVFGVVLPMLSLGFVSAHANNIYTAKAHQQSNC